MKADSDDAMQSLTQPFSAWRVKVRIFKGKLQNSSRVSRKISLLAESVGEQSSGSQS